LNYTNQHINQLIEQCKSGKQSAQLEIYNRYYKVMFNTAKRIVKDSYEAEDIMQEAFLTAFTKLDSLKETSTFGSWLKRIVINNSIQQYHKNQKHDDVPLNDVLYKVEDTPENEVITDNITNLKAKQVLDTMNHLKENYRVALTLHLIEGYDYEEISEILSISYANCRTTISRAKESLRKNLQLIAEY